MNEGRSPERTDPPAAATPLEAARRFVADHARWLAAAALVLCLAAAGWWLSRGIEVPTAVATQGSAAEVVYATGVVEPTTWAKVAALQRKRIVDMCHCEGRTVAKGDVLARLDDVEEKALLAELEARLKRFKEDAERLRLLLDRNATTRTLYEDKLTQVREYEARVQAQRDRILDLELRAPMDGVVLRRDGEIGEIAGINPGDVLFWVGQPKPLRVVAEISEDDIARVKEGQKVLLRHEGLAGQELTAVVGALTPKGDPLTKTFRAYLTLPEDTQLKIGMSVEANIVAREAANVVLLPAEAVADGAVIRIVDGRARRTPVVLGVRGTRMVEVRSGVGAGEAVVSPYVATLKEGARVRPVAVRP